MFVNLKARLKRWWTRYVFRKALRATTLPKQRIPISVTDLHDEDHYAIYELKPMLGDFIIIGRICSEHGQQKINIKHIETGEVLTLNDNYLSLLFQKKLQ